MPLHSTQRLASVIVEARIAGLVRPVIELERESRSAAPPMRTILLGLTWQVNERLSFDAAVRTGRTEAQHLNELRAGFTWTTGDSCFDGAAALVDIRAAGGVWLHLEAEDLGRQRLTAELGRGCVKTRSDRKFRGTQTLAQDEIGAPRPI